MAKATTNIAVFKDARRAYIMLTDSTWARVHAATNKVDLVCVLEQIPLDLAVLIDDAVIEYQKQKGQSGDGLLPMIADIYNNYQNLPHSQINQPKEGELAQIAAG